MGVAKSLIGLGGAVLVSFPVAAQLPPASVFGSLPDMESPAISADGRRLAFITHADAESFILVANIDGMQVTSAVQVNAGRLGRVFWASDEALVFTASTAEDSPVMPGSLDSGSPYGVNLAGDGEVTRLLQERARAGRGGGPMPGAAFFSAGGAQLVGWQRSSGNVLYPRFEVPDFERVLYAIDPKTDRQTVVDRGSRFTQQWVVNESGEPVFRVDSTQRPGIFTLLRRERRSWEVALEETTQIPEMTVYGLDGEDRLIVGARPDRERFALYVLDTTTGALGDALVASDKYDVPGARIDPYTHRVIGAAIADEGPIWFDDEFTEHQALLDEAFPGESAEILSWSADRRQFLVRSQSRDRAPAFYLYDAREPSVAQIGSAYTGLQGVQLPVRSAYSYAARDGVEIPAYLTRPRNASGATPLIVLPHAGPAARDYPGFDWMAHFLASRGYTVLQPSYRGSGGYGRQWEQAGFGQWGIGLMQHDLSDGVAALVAAGMADAERVCIVGAGYGGYAALAGAAFTPELYSCAAAIAPVSDLEELLGAEETRQSRFGPTVGYWRRAMRGGDEASLLQRLRAASPAAHAADVTAPVLLIHTRDDSVVPIAQSRIMESALQSAGKSVELIELEGQDHWLSVGPTRVATLAALEKFLASHLTQ